MYYARRIYILIALFILNSIISAEENISVEIVISAAGDCTFGGYASSSYEYTFDDEFNRNHRSYDYFFKNVKDIFAADDLTIVNLEGPLTDSVDHADKEFAFRGSEEYVNILVSGSVEAVNLANNHSRDYLKRGFDDTVRNLKDVNVDYFGMGYVSIREIKGQKIGLFGYRSWNPVIKRLMVDDIKNLRDKGCIIVIASFHWGKDREYYPDDTQKELAYYAIDSGADLVLGHHPHVIQGIEVYKGKNIVYSLGNFCFGGNRNPEDKDTFIFRQTFFLDDGRITGTEKRIIPCSISSIRDRNNFQPTPLEGSEKERVMQKFKRISDFIRKN